MSTRFIVSAVVGVAVGYFSGSPQAGFQAFSLAYGVTGSLDPNKKVQGPRLDDLKMASGSYGAPVAYIEGHPRVGGNIVWCTDKREVATESTQSGKGGPGVDTTLYTYECDLIVMLSENPGVGVRRIWSNGALIWTAADDADDDSLFASAETTSWREIRFYDGNSAQLPDPTYEAAVGVGNAPAYRDRSTVVIVGLNLGQSGQFPVLTFETYTDGDVTQGGFVEHFDDGFAPYTGSGMGSVWLITDGPYGQAMTAPGGPITAFSSGITRSIPTDSFTRMSIRFRLEYLPTVGGPDDAPFCVVRNGVNNVIKFWAAREQAFDSAQRASVILGAAGPIVPVSSGILDVFVWYQLTLEIVSSSEVVATLTLADGTVVDVTSIPGAYTSWAGDALLFFDESTGSGSWPKPGCTFDEIVLGAPSTRIALQEVPLDEVVQRQWQRAGLDLAYLDVTDLVGLYVRAMAVSQVTSPRQVIDTLAAAYLFECVESGAIVRMVRRGGAPALTIPFDDLGATDGDPIEAFPRTRGNELELPAQVSVKFANVDDDYQDGNESSTRLATGSSIVSTVEVPLGFTPTEAKRLAEISVTDALASIIRFGPVGLTRKYAAVEPTDVVLFTGKNGSTYRGRVLKRTDSGGVATIEGVLDDATAIDSSAVTSGGYNSSTIVRSKPATDLELLDTPILRDADAAAPGLYAVAKPITGSEGTWLGYALLESADDVSFSKVYDSTIRGVLGSCTSTLGDFTSGNVFDEANSLSVNVGDGELSSTTGEALISGTANAALVGSEIIQFRTATLTGAGLYTLTGLLRGRRGTEWAIGDHAASERFILLTEATLRRITDELPDIDVSRYWKGVTFGASSANESSRAFADTGVSLMPFAPVDFQITRDSSNNATIAWHRRSRLSSRFLAEGVDPPLGETAEAYTVEIWNSTYTTLKRTIASSSPSATYSAADQTTDFGSTQSVIYARVFQLSASIGRGYQLQAAA